MREIEKGKERDRRGTPTEGINFTAQSAMRQIEREGERERINFNAQVNYERERGCFESRQPHRVMHIRAKREREGGNRREGEFSADLALLAFCFLAV